MIKSLSPGLTMGFSKGELVLYDVGEDMPNSLKKKWIGGKKIF